MMASMFGALAAGRTRLRRARKLRAGKVRTAVDRSAPGGRRARPSGPQMVLAFGCVLLAAAGSVTIALHARSLAALADDPAQAGAGVAAGPAALQSVLPGAAFSVPRAPGVRVEAHGGATLLLVTGMRAEPARHVDLCAQLADPASGKGRILPLHAGLRFADAMALAARGTLLRNAMLASGPMPQLTISGDAQAPQLALRWHGPARWVGDGVQSIQAGDVDSQAALGRQGWLVWGRDGLLRLMRRPSAACPRAGELVLQLYHASPGAVARTLAVAFPSDGGPAVEALLAPGSYRVPAAPPAALEDQQLFVQLSGRGLVRLGADGLLELAPPDLAAWRAQGHTPWDAVPADDATARLLDHLYYRADGDFVREQVRIFNAERKLLAWRVRSGAAPAGAWEAQAGGMPVPLQEGMPTAASRLFPHLEAGWAPWQRVAAWPAGGPARLLLRLPAPAPAGQTLQLMLAGRLAGVAGAHLARAAPACLGHACKRADDVQVLDLVPDPGARTIALDAAPLPMDALAMPGDARYRHIVLRGGQPAWQALAPAAAGAASGAARPHAPVDVVLLDGAGRPLWHDGAPTAAAQAAGLATLLGVRAEQEGSVAGMLARLPGGGRHEAMLTLDLALQQAAQGALDCIGMRRGRWDGHGCSGGREAPPGRQAGIVVLDADTGAILAAAGAGMVPVDAANWREARDFDRTDPARSPLRLPAWQHDGGAERSPGSTFKIVSALGLELAAQHDRRLDALLDGMPLAAINAQAAQGGWAFRTEAPAYPPAGASERPMARITNFRDQGLDRHAQDGRLGIAQALTYSLNTWFAWAGELSDRSLAGSPAGGAPDLQPLDADALDAARPIVAMARRLGFGQALRLDGGLLPADYAWSAWDALQATAAGIDSVHTRHELRQMAIGLRMQATPLQMALAAAAVGAGRVVTPHLLARLDGVDAAPSNGAPLGVRLDRIRAGLKGVVDSGTAAGAFRGAGLEAVRRGLSGKTGTAPMADERLATVWFTGWLEPDSVPGQAHRLALAVFVSRSEATGGEHAAPVAAAVLRALAQHPVG